MNFEFNQKYINRANKSIAMVAMNGIIGDSRVLKTAQTLKKMGYQLTLFGVSKFGFKQVVDGYPFNIVLLPNPAVFIKRSDFSKEQAFLKAHTVNYAKSLLSEIENNIPDILHTHDMRGLVIGSFCMKSLKGKHSPAWIHDLHEYTQGYNIDGVNKKIFEFFAALERKHIHEPDALLTVSPSLASLLGDLHGANLDVVLNTPRISDFDSDFLDIRSSLGLDKTVPLAVYSGNTNPMRGVETIIDALPLIPELHIAFITNKTDNFIESLKSRAISLGVRNRVHFHPYVSFNKVTSFLRSADLGIHPVKRYLNAEIALPTKLFEYIHAGLPVVVSDNKTMADFVTKNKCGEVFEVGNFEDLAKSIRKVLSVPKDNFSQILQNLAHKYSWESQERVFDDIYSSLKLKSRKKIFYNAIVSNPKSQVQVPQSLLAPKIIDLDTVKLRSLSKKHPLKIAFVENNSVRSAIRVIEKKHLIRPVKSFHDLAWADIVIDDLSFGWYSGTAIQAMALGRIVISNIDDNLRHYLPMSSPIINSSADNLYKKLKSILASWDLVSQKGKLGRQFVEAWHDKSKSSFLIDSYLLKNEIEDVNLGWDPNPIIPKEKKYQESIRLLEGQVQDLESKAMNLRQAYLKRGEYLSKLKKANTKKQQFSKRKMSKYLSRLKKQYTSAIKKIMNQ